MTAPVTTSDRLGDLAERYWQHRLTTRPLFDTFLGDHRFDESGAGGTGMDGIGHAK